jgi:glycosyltransferase involved in cell wall biosynthesis
LVERYVFYQGACALRRGTVNHIVDHGYGHLGFSMEPSRTVCTFHDGMLLRLRRGYFPGVRASRVAYLGHQLSLGALRRMAMVIADSEAAKRDYVELARGDPERVRVVPLGVSGRFKWHPGQERLYPGPVLMHVGHNGFYKNIEGLLRALPLVSRRLGERVTLLKVGPAFSPEQLQIIQTLGAAANVQHRQRVSTDELVRLYNQADVLVMPSLYEGFGMPVLEAMACATPVVVSSRGALPEVAGDAALMVDALSDEALADAVVRVLSDGQLRNRLMERGLTRAAAFPWSATARLTADVYEEIA